MPIPKAVARANRVVANRLVRPVAGLVPGFGVVRHTGRRSGRPYRTPVMVYRRPGGYVIALTYGADTDWARNVVAAGGCELEVNRRRVRLVDPRIVRDETRRAVPAPIRPVLGALGVSQFLYLDRAHG